MINQVYYGILKNEVELIEEVNRLEWVSINDNFFDMSKYAGEGNIGHIIQEIKIDLENNWLMNSCFYLGKNGTYDIIQSNSRGI